MGDPNRHKVFANFVSRQFPKAKSVLVVADGKGELARILANKGLKIRVIENSPRFEGKPHQNIKYQKGFFTAHTTISEDVIIGMHPDEATGEIVGAAVRQGKPFAVVPCCVKGRLSWKAHSYSEWLKVLKSEGGGRETTLSFSGKNIVIWRK